MNAHVPALHPSAIVTANGTVDVLLVQATLHGCELRHQIGADALDHGNDDHCDACRDQPIFDRGRAALILNELTQDRFLTCLLWFAKLRSSVLWSDGERPRRQVPVWN